jgi:CheY-like chemotaxis protein
MAKILLIDDDPDVRQLMGVMLKKEGYEVETASRREEAIELLEKEKPSLILLDVLLSGSDGRELCREIKSNESTKDIPVIMLSGHPSASQQFESYGANDFVAKPVQTESLLHKLSQQISKS